LLGLLAGTANAAAPRQIVFPVVGPVKFYDDFGAPRSQGSHQGNDIMAARGRPVVAAERGRVRIYRGSWRAGCMLYLYGASGTTYLYIHLNDDLTTRDDNRATDCRRGVAYAPNLRNGQRVGAGRLIGYVGNSGDARGGAPHLHFELHPNGGRAVSPYRWLTRARRPIYAVPPGVKSVRLALFGTLRSADESLAVRTTRVAVLRGWRGRIATRRVALSYAPDFVVERPEEEESTLGTAALTTVEPGERVSVWTSPFRPTLRTQLASPNVLAAELVRLRGTG
jgi:hypothetical protein